MSDSDREEVISDGGYDTPVPELDDHRRQTPSVQREDRPRRGTFDSLYGGRRQEGEAAQAAQTTQAHPSVRVRDFEEAVVDDEPGDASPTVRRSRRPTVDTMADLRSISPPNSVKAFAEARRREREMSFSDTRRPEDLDLQRTTSVNSRYSHRSKPCTVSDSDSASLATNKSAEEDVCFPMQDEHRKDTLYIDFDYLEDFIRSEEEAHQQQERRPSAVRVFPDLRPESSQGPTETINRVVTADGDIIEMPSDTSMQNEKQEHVEHTPEPHKNLPQHDPNRFGFFSSAWESTIHAAELGDLVLPGEDIRGLFSFPKGDTDGVWWLNVNSPTEEEVRAICKAFGVHPLTIEDITTQESREKIELFPSYYFACFRSFNVVLEDGEPDYEPFNIYVVVFREGTLSFSFAPNAHATHVRRRIAMLKDYVALSSDWICYALIDDIVDSFAPVIHRIELDADAVEDEVFITRSDDTHAFLRKIGILRKNVMGLLRLLGGKADVLKGFTKRCNENYRVTPRMDIGLYLGDIQDHVVTMMTNLGHFEKILSRSHSNYLAQLSIDSINQGTRANEVLSKITFLASIIVPLNVITGLFGMNVHVPFQDTDNLHAFFVILGSLFAFCVVCIAVARRLRYI